MHAWYERLPKGKAGGDKAEQRTFGQWKFDGPPDALPPTLGLYLGDTQIDLKKLKLPEDIQLRSSISDAERKNPELQDAIQEIEGLVAETGPKASQSSSEK